MRALVLADRLGAELAPLTDKLPVPLLPVAGKELLTYRIEELVAAGVRDLVVVVSSRGEQASATSLGDGQRWGASIRYVLSRGEEAPSALWLRLHLADVQAVLVLRGDILSSPTTGAFLDAANSKTGAWAFCGDGGDPRGGTLLLRPGCQGAECLLDCLRWDEPSPFPPEGGCGVDCGALNCLDDLAAFHRANLDLVAGRFPRLGVGGRSLALGLYADRRAKVSPKSLKQGVAYVGANSSVHPEAELLGEVVIGAEVVVDRAATVRNSVILPRTYLGELVEVGDAVVSGKHLIRVDTGVRLEIGEAFLLGPLGDTGERARVCVWDRLAGLLLLVLSLPLWPVAAAAAALSGGGSWMGSSELVGNRAPRAPGAAGSRVSAGRGFVSRHWNTTIPVLRHLPALLAVIRGDLRLVGVAPLTPEDAATRTEDWQFVRDQAPAGLLGPTQLQLTADAPLDERLLSDAFYARQMSWIKDLGYFALGVKGLFSGEAWHRER